VLRRAGVPSLRDDFVMSELKAAYRLLARRIHPDMHASAGDLERQVCEALFRDVKDAYQLLAAVPN
jgi:DnaJ-class molecular chaperone